MRLAPLSEVPDGTTVARDVLGGGERAPLLRAGVTLTPDYREGLLRAGVHAIYIDDASSQGIDPPRPLLDEMTQERAARAIMQTYAEAKAALEARRPLEPDVGEALSSVLELMLGEVKSHGEAAVALRDMCAADAYTFQHSIDVTALGMFLGAHVFAADGWSPVVPRHAEGHSQIDERLLVLGMGLLLHDIGKLIIPTPIIQKAGPLTRQERELIEYHPQAGFDLLQSGAWSPLVKAIVLRHHERWDGTGYPGGLRGQEIHPMARIAAVADVYDAVTSERPYAPAKPAHEGLKIIAAGAGTQFDPRVAEMFLSMVAPFPPGVELRLSDGRRALVVEVPPQHLDRPLVRVLDGPDAPRELALSEQPELRIAGWDDVTRLAA
jgi:HD-GYP domain-containing protein (c-di-GMP phosphodiesterase class II)